MHCFILTEPFLSKKAKEVAACLRLAELDLNKKCPENAFNLS